MATTIIERQKEQTGLDAPTHHENKFPDVKPIQPKTARFYYVCVRCGHIWEYGALLNITCPSCKHQFKLLPPGRY